jgi:hypothetical protein
VSAGASSRAQGVRGAALGHPSAVELREDLDLLLDVVDLVLGVLEVDDLDGDEAARALIDAVRGKRQLSTKRSVLKMGQAARTDAL